MDYQDINAKTIDSWVKEGWQWGQPISHAEYMRAKGGSWEIYLTPTKPVPHSWLGEVRGKRVLGLASGGGEQMPVLCAAGAVCTVLDYSKAQCETEREVAAREGYSIEVLRYDMTKPLPFRDESFDIIVHPVSNCYIEDVYPVFKECFRILKKGGILLSGLDNGMNYIFDDAGERLVNKLPYNPLKDPSRYEEGIRTNSGIQFSHTFEEQIGGQLQAGFIITDVYEDTNGTGRLHEFNVPTFWATRAVKAAAAL